MAAVDSANSSLPPELRERLVRYAELAPCTTAFVDARTPGSDQKENFTIIGPGVAENPDQHVHIPEPHGFNIGGARQPPGCVNSQHSHTTAEVFVVHTGHWAFFTGEQGDEGRVELGPGDVISLPMQAFRGFENIGEETGFIFAALGGDDPGSVLWAPYVFEAASSHGLVLLENGQLIDTAAGETIPADAIRMPVTSTADMAELHTINSAQLERCVYRHKKLHSSQFEQTTDSTSLLGDEGIRETQVIGSAVRDAHIALPTGPLSGDKTFQLRHVQLQAGSATSTLTREQPEVLMMHSGAIELRVNDVPISLAAGDVFTIPVNATRKLINSSPGVAEIYVVHGTDSPVSQRI